MDLNSDLDDIEAVFLDLDGTIYLGGTLIDGAQEFLNRLKLRRIKRYFLSNNSSRSVEEYVEKLRGLGVDAIPEEVLLSTHDLIRWLASKEIQNVYLVGTKGMASMLEAAGISCNGDYPEAVVLGYDTEITYDKLTTASELLHSGIPLIASHPDIVCPSPKGGLPDVGAYLALFESTTGVKPLHVCGKPNATMITGVLEDCGLRASKCAMIGDRIYTDMAMAEASGVHGILVLSGEATSEDVDSSKIKPGLVVSSVAALCI